ncbi:MAG: adenosylcobinamide-GDP ribazoletransferase [Methanospirillum sp.]|nr:adenosylcobinamide-GDP ribazoletransferase [Methanospirillum sp.]
MIRPVLALLQFTTVLPLGRPVDFDEFADHSYLYPLSGYVTGGLAGLAAAAVPDPAIGAAVGLGAVLLVTGAHHLDGLLDLGDGLMAHGGRGVRVRALLDRQVGAGGFAIGTTVLLSAFAGLSSVPSLLWALVAAEVLGRFGMALLTAVGQPFREGIHGYLYGRAKRWFWIPAALLCTPLVLLPLPLPALAGAAGVALLVPLGVLALGQRLFGGLNGDLVGASHEVCRAAVLCTLSLLA